MPVKLQVPEKGSLGKASGSTYSGPGVLDRLISAVSRLYRRFGLNCRLQPNALIQLQFGAFEWIRNGKRPCRPSYFWNDGESPNRD